MNSEWITVRTQNPPLFKLIVDGKLVGTCICRSSDGRWGIYDANENPIRLVDSKLEAMIEIEVWAGIEKNAKTD